MIDRQLPSLGWRNHATIEEVLEAFAFLLLTKYSVDDNPTRVTLSYQRAWGEHARNFVPRVNGGRPAYSVVGFGSGVSARLIIAIEGMQSLGQLWTAETGAGSTLAGLAPGYVWGPAKTYADAIWLELENLSLYQYHRDTPTSNLCFTGFSLGAAVAEILADRFMRQYPERQYRLLKFGSPRVGNADWVNGASLPSDTKNIYANNDAVDLIPRMTPRPIEARLFPLLTAMTSYAPNTRQSRVTKAGVWEQREHEDTYANYLRACVQGRAGMSVENPWYWHGIEAYRLCLMNAANDVRGSLPYRFRYLELPGDNNWGNNYRPGVLDYADLPEDTGAPVPDISVPRDVDAEARHTDFANARPNHVAPMAPGAVGRPATRPPQPLWVPRRVRNF